MNEIARWSIVDARRSLSVKLRQVAVYNLAQDRVTWRRLCSAILLLITVCSALSFVPDTFALPRFTVPCSHELAKNSLAYAQTQERVQEATGNNDGPEVEAYLRSVGLSKGNPWCAAFVVASLDAVRNTEALPIARTGLANGIFADAARRGMPSQGYALGDLIIWKHAHSTAGHIGRIVQMRTNGFVSSLEGNTSSGTGDPREGNGVYVRRRNLRLPLGRMALRGAVALGR